MNRTVNSFALGLVAVAGLVGTPTDPAKTSVSIDPRRAAEVFDMQNAESVPLPDLLRAALTVQNDGEAGAFVLHVFILRAGKTVSHFTSRAFTPPTGKAWLLPPQYLPGDQFLGDRRVREDGLTSVKKAVPVAEGVAEPGRFIVNGVFANKPSGWQKMDAVYFIMVPERATSEADASSPYLVMTDPMGEH